MIKLYELLVGKIQSEICYIVSDRHEKTPMNNRVYTCDEIPANVESIIISSRVYQKEMLENLKRNGILANRAVVLYRESDWFDLAFVAEMNIWGEL